RSATTRARATGSCRACESFQKIQRCEKWRRRKLAGVRKFALLFLIVAACRRETSRPNVNLISLDTLRCDHLPAYGYRGVATPNIDALRNDSILFEHAYSHVPLTLPSHATMLTG